MDLPIIKTPFHNGIYLFRRAGDNEWRPTEVFNDDSGNQCAYKTWQTMQFPTKNISVYNAWTTSYEHIGLFVGDWILLQIDKPVPEVKFITYHTQNEHDN